MRTFTALTAALALLGCATTHVPDAPLPETERPLRPIVEGERAEAFLPRPSMPRSCFEDGGALTEIASIDNDDTVEHGDVLALGVAPDRRIAVATTDGSVKLWTLEGFLGELTPGSFLYGVEVERAQVLDLAFWGERVVVADVQGLVSSWTMVGGFNILGGTDPDIRVHAVAIDEARGRLAHADEREGGHVMVRGLTDATTFGPLETWMTEVTDLAFLDDGRLVVAGGNTGPQLQLRGAEDPTAMTAQYSLESFAPDFPTGPFREVTTAGDQVIAAHPEALVALEGELAPRWHAELGDHAPVSVSVSGQVVVTVGAEGSIAAWALEDGRPLARADVDDPVSVRVDPGSGAAVVASRDGMLRVFDCR